MVDMVTNVSRSGLREWLLQRITAVIIGAYFIFLLIYLLAQPHLTYQQWLGLFAHPLMVVFSVFALLSVLFHAWIGVWIVFTDYVKFTWVRLFLQLIVVGVLFGYLIWGIDILW